VRTRLPEEQVKRVERAVCSGRGIASPKFALDALRAGSPATLALSALRGRLPARTVRVFSTNTLLLLNSIQCYSIVR
jgi:hypothetical protein